MRLQAKSAVFDLKSFTAQGHSFRTVRDELAHESGKSGFLSVDGFDPGSRVSPLGETLPPLQKRFSLAKDLFPSGRQKQGGQTRRPSTSLRVEGLTVPSLSRDKATLRYRAALLSSFYRAKYYPEKSRRIRYLDGIIRLSEDEKDKARKACGGLSRISGG